MALGGALGLRDAYVTSTWLSQTISHTSLSHIICHIPSLSHTICLNVLLHTIFHTIFVNNSLHAHLCHTPSFRLLPHTHHHLSHTLRHIPSFTHNFVAHRLSHTNFHKSLWLKQKRMEQKTFWTSNSCFVCRHLYLAASPACLQVCFSMLFWPV